jgi:hypothetical protein
MKHIGYIILLVLVIAGVADGQLKKRIGIARFDDRSGSDISNLGKGVDFCSSTDSFDF